MLTKGFVYHSTVPGRMAIISLMTSLCKLDNEVVTEGLFLYLLKMMKRTGSEVNELWDAGKDVKDLTKLLSLSVQLLCFFVTNGKDAAKAVLAKNNEERKTLEELLEEQDSGIPDESRLEILYILDQIDKESSRPSAAVGGIGVLLKMAKSPSAVCRAQGASRLLKFVERGNETERQKLQEADGISVLMVRQLLQRFYVKCSYMAVHIHDFFRVDSSKLKFMRYLHLIRTLKELNLGLVVRPI